MLPMAYGNKARILFLTADPARSTDKLEGINESRKIFGEIKYNFEGIYRHFLMLSDLQSMLLRYSPQIVHISGIGSSGGSFIFQDENGNVVEIEPSVWANLFEAVNFDNRIRCVFLSACYSAQLAEQIVKHVDCVVGTKPEVNDKVATEFAKGFYRALAGGADVRIAFEIASNQLELEKLQGYKAAGMLAYTYSIDPSTIFFAAKPAELDSGTTGIENKRNSHADMKKALQISAIVLVDSRPEDPLKKILTSALEDTARFYNLGKSRIVLSILALSLDQHLMAKLRESKVRSQSVDSIRSAETRGFSSISWDAESILSAVKSSSVRASDRILVLTNLEVTPPPDWAYILWSRVRGDYVVSIAPMDPTYWLIVSSEDRFATIKQRARTACLNVVGQQIGLERCRNFRCFLRHSVQSVNQLDEMVVLGPEHEIIELANKGFASYDGEDEDRITELDSWSLGDVDLRSLGD